MLDLWRFSSLFIIVSSLVDQLILRLGTDLVFVALGRRLVGL